MKNRRKERWKEACTHTSKCSIGRGLCFCLFSTCSSFSNALIIATTYSAKAGGALVFFSIFVIQAAGKASEIMANFWLTYWAEATANSIVDGTTVNTVFYLNIYAAFGLGGVLMLTFRSIAMAVHRLKASRKLHDDLTASILRAPVAFFDVTPTGRVLNRFAADMDKIDLELTQSLGQAVSTMYSVLGAVSAIVAATKGTLLIALAPIGYFN